MAAPSMATFYAGQRLRAADMNAQVRDAVNWTIAGKTCRAIRTGSQSISNAFYTGVNLTSEDFDPMGWHDSAGAFPNIIVPNIPGYYQVEGSVEFVAVAGGVRQAYINARTFGAGPFRMAGCSDGGSASYPSFLSVSTVVYMNGSTDYVELLLWQNSGAALNTSVASGFNTSLCCTLIGT